MSDSRGFSNSAYDDGTAYPTLGAVMNFLYAKRHGYRFTVFTPAWESESVSHYVPNLNLAGASCVHIGSHAPRHASWCKILTAWLVATSVGRGPAGPVPVSIADTPSPSAPPIWVMYLDSDAIFVNFSVGIPERFAAHSEGPPLKARVDESSAIFLDDFQSGNPNAGIFAFKPGVAAAKLFEQWWTAPDRGSAMTGLWEQASLWAWAKEDYWRERVALVNEGPWWDNVPGLWVRHWAGPIMGPRRERDMLEELQKLGLSGDEIRESIREIAEHHSVRLDVVDVAARLEEAAGASGRRSRRARA